MPLTKEITPQNVHSSENGRTKNATARSNF